MSITIPILCFNDVYRVNQRYVPQPGAPDDRGKQAAVKDGYISVSQFGKLLLSQRASWAKSPSSSGSPATSTSSASGEDGEREQVEREGLVLFAGDLFSPSVESSVTRGSHMVPVMNALKVDCACVGNHDFDFGFPHLSKLIESTTFPWLLSNIVDENTGKTPEPMKSFWVTEKCGVRIGVIGLVEQDWIATIPSWPDNFSFRPMVETAIKLSKELRDPNGPHKVDIIITLTHCRVPNDIRLANELGAVKGKPGVEKEHGVDLIIGGHDHIYYIGKGADQWKGFAGEKDVAGTKEDQGVRVIKSGTDFRDLSSATLEVSAPANNTRRRTIASLKGEHHYILPSSPSSQSLEMMLKSLLSSVSETISKPVCWTLTPFDARSELVRTRETGLGNWAADVLLHAFAESGVEGKDFFEKQDGSKASVSSDEPKSGEDGGKGADAVIICGGTLRGDSQYGPGKITLGDILEIFPFDDPVVCIEGIWDALESSLSKWPAQEGRFPIIAGLAVQWDHNLPPNQRIKSIHLIKPPPDGEDEVEFERPEDLVDFVEQEDGTRVEVKQRKFDLGEEVKRDGSRTYRIITREYMAQGYDGFEALKNRKFIVDDETGQIMSSIIRSFLLGSSYIFRHEKLMSKHIQHLSTRTDKVLSKARARGQYSPSSSLTSSPRSPYASLHRSETIPSPFRTTSSRMTEPEPNPWDRANLHSSGTLFSPTSERSVNSDGWGIVRRHVVKHDWASIRDALHIAKHEHMSDVDTLQGDTMRKQHYSEPDSKHQFGDATPRSRPLEIPKSEDRHDKPHTADQAAAFIQKQEAKELEDLANDLAIVCPLIDGRLRDLGEGKEA